MRSPSELDDPEDARILDRYLSAGLAFMVVLIVAFPVYRAQEQSRLQAAREAMQRENIFLGDNLHELHCAACHGPGSRGGRSAPTLRAKEFLTQVSDKQLRWLIAAGVPGTSMPAYDIDHGGPLTAQAIDQLVAYLRSLEEKAPSVPDWRMGKEAQLPTQSPSEAEEPSLATATVAKARFQTPPASGSLPPAASGVRPPKEVEISESATAAIDSSTVAASTRTATTSGAGSSTVSLAAFSDEGRTRAKAIYAQYCAACHGPAGGGTSFASPLRRPVEIPKERLVQVIGQGVTGTPMMAFGKKTGGPLDQETVEDLARWLRERPH